MDRLSDGVFMVIQRWKPINIRIHEDGKSAFSETSVRNSGTRYKAPEGNYNRLRVLERRVLRKIFGLKRDKVTEG
jgi:hypothetical protein